MRYFTPARIITSESEESLEPLFALLSEEASKLKGFRHWRDIIGYPDAKIFVKGNPLLSWFSDDIPILRYESYFFLLLEYEREADRIIISLQNYKYTKSAEELVRYLPLFDLVDRGRYSVSDWVEAGRFPKSLLSNSFSFLKMLGLKGIF